MGNLERWHGDDRRSGGERRKSADPYFMGTEEEAVKTEDIVKNILS